MKHEQYTEQQLDEAIARLPKDIMPERELWTQIEQRLPERGVVAVARGNNRHRWAAVLVLGLAGLLGWRLLLVPMPGTGSPDAPLITGEPAEQTETGRSGEALGRDDPEQQRAEGLAGIDRSTEPLDNWQRHLAVWDEAIARVRTGLEYYPEEPVLLAQLESLYQQQMDYLQLVSATETGYY